jgi:hypothetical protein
MLTGKKMVGVVLLAVCLSIVVSSVGFAADPNAPAQPAPEEPKMLKVQGMVNVVKDANNVITAVTVKAKEVVYNVVLDKKGLELGEKMANKEAEVHGTIVKKDGKESLKVVSYKPVEEKPAA